MRLQIEIVRPSRTEQRLLLLLAGLGALFLAMVVGMPHTRDLPVAPWSPMGKVTEQKKQSPNPSPAVPSGPAQGTTVSI